MISLLLAAALTGGVGMPWRLPDTVVPSHYRISLDLDIEGERFTGDETIEVSVVEPTREIVLNSLGLEIKRASVRHAEGEVELDVTVDETHERITLRAPRAIEAGNASIDITWIGSLKEGLRGLYLSRSGDDVFAATQMQATYARLMFPSFDEPAFKATFTLDVTVPADAAAISNGPVVAEERLDDSRKRVRFGKSPVMSTYLLSLAIGRYGCLTETVDDIPVRVCGRPDKKDQLRFAMDVTRDVLTFLNDWYGIEYPFGKLDLVAIPDYEWGGMENTAAISFREVLLLVDPEMSSPARKRRVAGLVAHEIAHQWFGDLVTTAWWDDIWLNEGFATWMTPKAVAAFEPEWQREEEAAAAAQFVMGLDSLTSTRAIHGEAATPGEIKEMFDGIAYTKGAAILRMLEAWVGEETFRKGVNAYLEAHANGNATSEDLWKAVANMSGKNVDEIMPAYVLQPGVPVVTMGLVSVEDGTDLVLEQKRFLTNGAASKELWKIPVCIRAGLEDGTTTEVCELLADRKGKVRLPSGVKWIVGNVGGKGYYRVGWKSEQLASLNEVVRSLDDAERLSLVADAWAMTEAGELAVDAFLDFVSSYRGERNREVIAAIASSIGDVRRSLLGGARNAAFDAWTASFFADLAADLGTSPSEKDDDERRSLRGTMLSLMADAGDESTIEALRSAMSAYLEDPSTVDPSIAEVAFDVVPRNGDQKMFDRLVKTLETTDASLTYDLCLSGLTQFRDAGLVERAVQYPESGSVRLDRYPAYYEALLRNSSSREAAWSYMKEHWTELKAKVVSFGGRGAMRAIGSFCSPEQVADVRAFFAKHDVPGAERALALSLEQADACIRFRDMQEKKFEAWLIRAANAESKGQ